MTVLLLFFTSVKRPAPPLNFPFPWGWPLNRGLTVFGCTWFSVSVYPHRLELSCHVYSSEATGNSTLNSSPRENITLVNRSFGSSEGAYNNSLGNVTLAKRTVERNSSVGAYNNYSGNATSPNNTAAAHNSNITVAKKSGKIIGNNTCFETKYISKRAFVKSFTISYSNNAENWEWYYEGGSVKVAYILNNFCSVG